MIRIPFLHSYKGVDFLDATANISIWSNVEAGLGITAGSLVSLRPLFHWFRDPSSMGGSKSNSTRTDSVPLSGVNGERSTASSPQYWRPDLNREDHHTVITTIHTSNGSEASRTSSQEDLDPTHGSTFFQGVNVQKPFDLSEDQTS
ncbi:Integral membrane protein, putative [Penicillium digitatum PHI26]|uniref:Integral membrane protein, putative n=3 Tax=Penicillium digitatum TaxID=36651 RepID=K9G5H8_PEND2|nr:Integral membrane protein, putative [Penicillium digitatum Pd1]EKV16192.1 Integral membrane protein, putative [Penicillium digitatum PHI26]EKV19389.1 Integral membrane protein, putative [Penicillium digitatum Pd1]